MGPAIRPCKTLYGHIRLTRTRAIIWHSLWLFVSEGCSRARHTGTCRLHKIIRIFKLTIHVYVGFWRALFWSHGRSPCRARKNQASRVWSPADARTSHLDDARGSCPLTRPSRSNVKDVAVRAPRDISIPASKDIMSHTREIFPFSQILVFVWAFKLAGMFGNVPTCWHCWQCKLRLDFRSRRPLNKLVARVLEAQGKAMRKVRTTRSVKELVLDHPRIPKTCLSPPRLVLSLETCGIPLN